MLKLASRRAIRRSSKSEDTDVQAMIQDFRFAEADLEANPLRVMPLAQIGDRQSRSRLGDPELCLSSSTLLWLQSYHQREHRPISVIQDGGKSLRLIVGISPDFTYSQVNDRLSIKG